MKVNGVEIVESKLTKTDWKLLEKHGILENSRGYGNGYSNTLPAFDRSILLGKTPSIVFVRDNVYTVRYMSGCFLPVWTKITCALTRDAVSFGDLVLDGFGRAYRPSIYIIKKTKEGFEIERKQNKNDNT